MAFRERGDRVIGARHTPHRASRMATRFRSFILFFSRSLYFCFRGLGRELAGAPPKRAASGLSPLLRAGGVRSQNGRHFYTRKEIGVKDNAAKHS